MTYLRLAYVNVAVSDLDRPVAFLRDRVGLSLRFSDADFGYAEFDTPGAGFVVGGIRNAQVATPVPVSLWKTSTTPTQLSEAGVEFTRPPTFEPGRLHGGLC